MKTVINGRSVGIVLFVEKDKTVTVVCVDNLREYKELFESGQDMSGCLELGVFPDCPRIKDEDLQELIEQKDIDIKANKVEWFKLG